MTSALAILALSAVADTTSIEQYTQPDLRDASFTAHVVRSDQRELAKINKDYGRSYQFEHTSIQVKEPFKLRLDTKVEDTSISYVLNGTHQMYKLRGAHIVQDLSRSPGKRQTWLDFGVITPTLFHNFFDARFVRNDRATGDVVFDLTYVTALNDTSRNRIWIDKSKHIVDKREWYNQYGRLLATFDYGGAEQQRGVWLPTSLTVRNVDGAVAGVTRYDSIRINGGISDDRFALR